MKKAVTVIGLCMILGLSLQAGEVKKNDAWVGFQLTAIHHTTLAGFNFEHGIGHNLALGLEINLWLEGVTGMVLSHYLAYHFPLQSARLDLFVAAGPAIAFGVKMGGTDIRVKLQSGARYWIGANTALYFKLVSEIGENELLSGTGGNTPLGVTIGLNLRF